MKLAGKRAVITGASQGLGRTIAASFAQQGCDLLLCARNEKDLAEASQQISLNAPAKVFIKPADISIEADVQALVDSAMEHLGGLDIVVCNAGIYGPKGRTEEVDWQSWVDAIHINLLGTVSCCRLFLPLLRKSRRGKIILLSGGGATKPLPFLSAYAASKAAVVRFGETLAEEVKSAGIDVNSVAPGALNTRLLNEILEAGPDKVGKSFYDASLKQKESGGTSLETGAELCVYLASDESHGITGKLISAVWDPWQQFQEHEHDLQRTDVYTLRRIVPAERGLPWG
ncbi:MAG: SDR family oxidoreductase [Acidobacteriaceae bacterium]|nr:SDR family oxidoreductase [Acidobacteriaceae bacterium]